MIYFHWVQGTITTETAHHNIVIVVSSGKCLTYEIVSETVFINMKEEVGAINMDAHEEPPGILQLIEQL